MDLLDGRDVADVFHHFPQIWMIFKHLAAKAFHYGSGKISEIRNVSPSHLHT